MTKSLTEGKPFRLIIGFAFPMFLGMLFQQCYNMVDTVIVGKFLGVEPLAGVGSTASVVFIVIGFCNGVCNGFGVPIAQMFGAKQESGLRRFVANSSRADGGCGGALPSHTETFKYSGRYLPICLWISGDYFLGNSFYLFVQYAGSYFAFSRGQ